MRTLFNSVSFIAALAGGAAIIACSAESDPVQSGTGGASTGTGGTTAGLGGSPPGVGGTTPGVGGTTPGVGGTTPGTGGAAPSDSCTPGASATEPLIDDLSDGDNAIAAPRQGWWYTFNDSTNGGTTVQVPAPDPTGVAPFEPSADGADFAAVTSGTMGSTEEPVPYAGIGFALNGSSAGPCTYNATGFAGIKFRAKGTVNLRVKFPTPATVPTTDGGTCATGCYDDYGYVVTVTPDWAEHTVPFAMATQEGWGTAAGTSLDITQILQIQFQTSGAVAGSAFEFAIDDVTFY